MLLSSSASARAEELTLRTRPTMPTATTTRPAPGSSLLMLDRPFVQAGGVGRRGRRITSNEQRAVDGKRSTLDMGRGETCEQKNVPQRSVREEVFFSKRHVCCGAFSKDKTQPACATYARTEIYS
eukprot:3193725-Prymnesium_polylepis.1